MGLPRLTTKLSPNISVSFTQGKFDSWCIELIGPDYPKYPTDEWYFGKLKEFAKFQGPEVVYDDFVVLYDKTTKDFDKSVINWIIGMSYDYPYPLEVQTIFTVLYYGMIAEENKENTKLGKRIKRLGVHELLVYGDSVKEAAHSMRGQIWQVINDRCREAGF